MRSYLSPIDLHIKKIVLEGSQKQKREAENTQYEA